MLFIFDMGGVVTRDDGFARRLGSILDMTVEEFNATVAGGCNGGVCRADIMLSLTNGEITAKQFWKEFGARSGRNVSGDPCLLAFNPTRDEAVADIIRALRSGEYTGGVRQRVVCGTNTIECHYMEHIERADYALFDKVYASNRIGVSKPDERFWQVILQAEEVDARDAFFTDDREDNCQAAAKLGINVCRFTNAAEVEHSIRSVCRQD